MIENNSSNYPNYSNIIEKVMHLEENLKKQQYILNGMRPSSKKYQAQHEAVRRIKRDLEWWKQLESEIAAKISVQRETK